MIKVHNIKRVKSPQKYFGGTAFINFAVGRRRIQFSLRPPTSTVGQVTVSVIEGVGIALPLIAGLHAVGLL